jgi:hypothetical protein
MPDSIDEFTRRFPVWAGLAQRREGDLEIGVPGQPALLVLSPDDGRWLLHCEFGHAHPANLEEAFELISALLSGRARWANEYRSDFHSASWLEILEDGIFTVQYSAFFLCPLDADEFELWPGEVWKVVLKAFKVGDLSIEVETSEVAREESLFAGEKSFEWLAQALGPANEGMRWTVGFTNRFVLQVPRGWRRLPPRSSEIKHADFAPRSTEFMFRALAYFRDTQSPHSERNDVAERPQSVKVERLGPSERDPGWAKDIWTCMFSDGQLDMMAVIELWYRSDEPADLGRFRDAIEASVPYARFVPDEWRMSRE